jgi:radical SAM family protein
VLNEQPGVLAERTYSVWPDLEQLMRDRGVPQFTVDAHRPVSALTCSASPSRPNSATPTC